MQGQMPSTQENHLSVRKDGQSLVTLGNVIRWSTTGTSGPMPCPPASPWCQTPPPPWLAFLTRPPMTSSLPSLHPHLSGSEASGTLMDSGPGLMEVWWIIPTGGLASLTTAAAARIMSCFIHFRRENGMIWKKVGGRRQFVNMTGPHQQQFRVIGAPGARGQPVLSCVDLGQGWGPEIATIH